MSSDSGGIACRYCYNADIIIVKARFFA